MFIIRSLPNKGIKGVHGKYFYHPRRFISFFGKSKSTMENRVALFGKPIKQNKY
jgi:hypothetical protein